MAITRGGLGRRSLAYKVTFDNAVTNTMVVDVTGAAGAVYALEVITGGGAIFLRFYDALAPVAGTTVPVMTFMVPAASTFSTIIPEGIGFVNGISYCATKHDSNPSENTAPDATATLYLTTT
tara:strand:- start:12141 stop:12506 length:366 start_codon:yes stop_codon:yes gene_type:complete